MPGNLMVSVREQANPPSFTGCTGYTGYDAALKVNCGHCGWLDNNQEERWWFETSELEWLLLTAARP